MINVEIKVPFCNGDTSDRLKIGTDLALKIHYHLSENEYVVGSSSTYRIEVTVCPSKSSQNSFVTKLIVREGRRHLIECKLYIAKDGASNIFTDENGTDALSLNTELFKTLTTLH